MDKYSLQVRLIVAGATLVLLGGISVVAYILGMMFTMFAGEGADPAAIPAWLEIGMLLGWPIVLGISVISIAAMIAAGLKWKWLIPGVAVCLLASGGWFLVGFIKMISLSVQGR